MAVVITDTTQLPGIERVQALADISHSALCCHSNETRALIAILPNSAQLEGIPTIHPTYIWLCPVVWGMRRGTDRHTDSSDQHTFRFGYASHEM